MYVGRIVSVALTEDGRWCAAYRVSSRSFPNRRALVRGDTVSIVPKPGHESDVEKNPYIAYNCVRIACGGSVAVASNGSHTDPIAEKLDSGMGVRDAIALSLLTLDFERDAYDTPRICAVADTRAVPRGAGWLGVVRRDGLHVRQAPLTDGRFRYVATYEENDPIDGQAGAFPVRTASEACDFMLCGGIFAQRTHPVTAVAVVANDRGFTVAVQDAARD